jgi:hypothetical protein
MSAMQEDSRGLPMTASSAEAAQLFDATLAAYCGLRRDTGERLKRALAADPQLVLGHVIKGYFMLLFATRAMVPRAASAARAAAGAIESCGATPRETRHLAALEAWIGGELDGAVSHWQAILEADPRDLMALKLAQYGAFYLGQSRRMLAATEGACRAWDEGAPGFGFTLGCHAFSLEECGALDEAERTGRRAVALEPADIWAAHAVAHVAEMEDRAEDGLAWIAAHERDWSDVNNFVFHVRWHRCLFLLAQGRDDDTLALYDREVRAESSDDYLDISNAVSLLWRLEQEGVAVGARWTELASHARAHQGDHCLVFADLHYLMALAASGDGDGVARWQAGAHAHAAASGDDAARVLKAAGLALAAATLAHRGGDWRGVVETLAPIRRDIARIGGSHAQRDLYDEMLIDAALRADPALAQALLAERLARRPRNAWALARRDHGPRHR